ncbi:MAG TPA: aminotransferase class V-fold PLP-dependent enzyme [Firmicutes bacterium]|nr:aminotransferase class V-fold PLP-dependent enzyme [Bacillota bacterium]
MSAQVIYLDHAATSWPKPPDVTAAMSAFLEKAGGNPGRAGHRLSIAAARIIYDTREALAELLGVGDPLRLIFTKNATEAINIVLQGCLRPGDRVVTTGMEHNAVMRPLTALAQQGVEVVVVPGAKDGRLPVDRLEAAITPGTRLVVAAHANNVTGTILPLAEVVAAVRRAGAELLVDAAQTAGSVPLHVDEMGIDYLAFSGHKGLLGPPGTGGLAIGRSVRTDALPPLLRGGTGSRSESLTQPEYLPDKYESGTPNGVGLAGLGAAVRYILKRGLAAIQAHEEELRRLLYNGLSASEGVTVYGNASSAGTAVVSFTIKGLQVSEVGERLDDDYGILCRVGLHCAPAVHRTIGTFPDGTIRFAPGPFITVEEIKRALEAVREVAGSA